MVRFIRGIFGCVVAALIIYAGVLFSSVRQRLTEAEEKLAVLETEAEQLRQENRTLSYDVARAGDADAIADIARDQLGLVLPGDRIYIVENGN